MVFLLVSILIGVAGALLTYRGFKPIAMFTLRAVGLALLFAFLLGLSWQSELKRSPKVTVLLDVSESMAPLLGWQDSVIKEIRAPKGFKMEKYIFSGFLSKYRGSAIQDTGRVTDIERAISEATGDLLLLISDGLYNTPKDPLEAAYQKKVPIYVLIPPKKSTKLYDVVLKKVEGERRILEGGEAEFYVTIEVTGGRDYTGTLLVSEGDSILRRVKVDIRDGGSVTKRVSIPFDRVGAHEISFSITPKEGERTDVNNVRKFTVLVRRGAREAWVLAWHPSPNVRVLRSFFESVPGWGARVLVQEGSGRWVDAGKDVREVTFPPKGKPDLWILVDPEPSFLKKLVSQETIEHLFILLEEPKRAVYQVLGLKGARRLRKKKYYLSISPGFLDSLNVNESVDLPPIGDVIGVLPPLSFKPIVTIPAWKTPKGNLPVVSMMVADRIKEVLVQTGDLYKISLWNSDLFRKIFLKILENLYKGEGIYAVGVSKTVYFEGEPIEVWADAQSSEGEPINDLNVNLIGLDREVPLWPQGKGHYRSPRLFLPPGSYNLKVAFKKGRELHEKDVSFKVVVGSPEVYDVGVDSTFLERIANESGGDVFRTPDDLSKIPKDRFLKRETVAHSITKTPLFLLLFIGLMGFEWGLRKWRGLP